MYGGILTDNGDGTFTHTNGPRKYSQLDQYMMGIRPATEVETQWYVNVDGSIEGSPAMPGRPGTTHTFSGTRVNFTVDDIIRANGPRNPATSPCHLKFAFILYHEAGSPPFPAQIEKVDNYRHALEQWWPEGTDYRGSIDTRLSGCGMGTEGCLGWESRQCATWVGDDDPVEPPDCVQGTTRCASLTEVQICAANGSWVLLTQCDDGQHCDAGSCVDESGNPVDGDRPDGDQADGDAPDGDTGKPDGDDSDDPDPDFPDGDVPGDLCTPGELRCFGEIRHRCSATRVDWLVIEDCAEKGMSCTPEECVSDSTGGGCQSSGKERTSLLLLLGLALLGMLRARVRRESRALASRLREPDDG